VRKTTVVFLTVMKIVY